MSPLDAAHAHPWLLVSDIDDTLTGDPDALLALADALEQAGDALLLSVNSSRPAASVAATLAEEFPANLRPAATITALGTEISVGGAQLGSWQSQFSGWPHRRVFEILSELGHVPHDSIYQTKYKVSFAVSCEQSQANARRALSQAGIACEIIASGPDDFDVIPKGAGKAAATLFLVGHFGVDRARLVVAGDSGNDLAMFLAARHRIAVGNARRELIDALEPRSFYHARMAHAAGVHEGLMHFGALPNCDEKT
ncbi:HAD family hydrolase [Roseobacter sp. YSTF-M11]|uniref:HAD family hydrolase n=1 Tax=Roseobacter insulae TaxID=2859783 RepID=A0A9X1FVW7_9RHOB|nr:HAD-IIB family hydrolase [Roseobacter insulae]MBW4709040.1 HAD family hydrolase [Roseobacter insulae]